MFFIIEKSEETTFEFSQNSVSIIETQKIINLLNDSSNDESKFATKECYVTDRQTTKAN